VSRRVQWLVSLLAGVCIAAGAWAAGESQELPRHTKKDVMLQLRRHHQTAKDKIDLALARISRKDFLAARSAADDAQEAITGLREALPWQHAFHDFDVAVDKMRTLSWGEAKEAIDDAERELDFVQNFAQVKAVRPVLEKCREAMDQHNADLARQHMKEAKRLLREDAVTQPLQQAEAYLDKAKGQLLALPTLFRGERDKAKRNVERASAQLARAWPRIEEYMSGEMKERPAGK
jgi:hypothetical protein